MWTKICNLEPRGHKLFREDNGFRAPELCPYAIADDSGNTPDETDDGALYLDFSKPLRLLGSSNMGLRVSFAVLDRDGESMGYVSTGLIGGITLLQRFPAWTVSFDKYTQHIGKFIALVSSQKGEVDGV